MGGMGSGASRFRRLAEETKRIDIREWRRLGRLKGSWRFTWSWTCLGETSGSISVATEPGLATLAYTVGDGDERQEINERIQLRGRPCRFGGQREYFACPRCCRAAEVLYLARGRFLCRKCARVGYSIENLAKQWRADRRRRELEEQLNEDGSRPARMRWATYNLLCDRIEAYDAASWTGIERLLARLMARQGPA